MPKTLQDKRILICPANYYLDGGVRGSEALWSHELIRGAAAYFSAVTAVAGYAIAPSLPPNVRLVETDPKWANTPLEWFKLSVALHFLRRYTFASIRELSRGKYDILHHMLPFAIDRTVSVVPFLTGKPFMIGPVQGIVNPRAYSEAMVGRYSEKTQIEAKGSTNTFARVLQPVLSLGNHLMLKRADAVIAISDVVANDLKRHVHPDKLFIIPPGVDTSRFLPQERQGPITLLVSGYLVPRKRVETVLYAFARILALRKDVRLMIAGDGPENSKLQALANNLRLTGVTWLGFVSNAQMHEIYAQADVLVSGSEFEGLPTAYLEAMSCGLPIVSAKNPGSIAVNRMTNAMLLCEVGDDNGMASCLLSLLERSTLKAQKQNIRQFAVMNFDWSVISGRYAEVYETVLRRRNR